MDNNVESINRSFSKKLVSVDAPKTKKIQDDINGEPTTPNNMYDFFSFNVQHKSCCSLLENIAGG